MISRLDMYVLRLAPSSCISICYNILKIFNTTFVDAVCFRWEACPLRCICSMILFIIRWLIRCPQDTVMLCPQTRPSKSSLHRTLMSDHTCPLSPLRMRRMIRGTVETGRTGDTGDPGTIDLGQGRLRTHATFISF